MKTIVMIFALLLTVTAIRAQELPPAQWITTTRSQSATNTWIAYRKTVQLSAAPAKALASIAADSKYWLWINGKLVVFEGALKRGPNPQDTYVDEVDLAPHLRQGENTIAILLCYFGKDGFSHKSSGRAALYFDCMAGNTPIRSNRDWKTALMGAYQAAGAPYPNWRLSEPNLLFDARSERKGWEQPGADVRWMEGAKELGIAGVYPWNRLITRPIPQWKDYGMKAYRNAANLPAVSSGDTIVCELPYNAQVTPYFEIEAEAGGHVQIFTDNYYPFNGAESNIRGEYITRAGAQSYEHLLWMNGHKVYYIFPKGVKIKSLQYRETGYNTEFSGTFECSDPFFNRLREKALRTLYVTMRDNFMDCPERERAQWTGDAVNEAGEVFYTMSPSAHQLIRKWLHEVVSWQQPDGKIYAPVPAGNWFDELPCQVLSTLGYYGIWTYYLNTGDKATIADLYDGAKKYLLLWEPDGTGLMKFRGGDWTWGDWGDNRDLLPMYNLWYYIALDGMERIARELNKPADAARFAADRARFHTAFNARFWNGTAYRDPAYKGKTDDRTQALAVVSGIAGREKYAAIMKIFAEELHASPYMEKYVFEAMFRMGYPDEALARHKARFSDMVGDDRFTTLFEGWGIGEKGFGGGTVNHAWSGGGLTVLSQYLCGIEPLSPGYDTIRIMPRPGKMEQASAVVPSVKGMIRSAFTNRKGRFLLEAETPASTATVIAIPAAGVKKIKMNNKIAWANGAYAKSGVTAFGTEDGYVRFLVGPGKYRFEAEK